VTYSEQDSDPVDNLLEAREDEFLEVVRVGVGPVSLAGLKRAVRRPMAWPDPFQAKADHYVVWLSNEPFTIVFSYPRPTQGANVLEAVPLADDPKFHDATFVAVAKMRVDSATGHPYKYTLTVLDQEGGRLRSIDPGGHVDRDPKKLG